MNWTQFLAIPHNFFTKLRLYAGYFIVVHNDDDDGNDDGDNKLIIIN